MSRLDEIRERLQSREAFRVRGAQTWTAEADADITWLLSEVERLATTERNTEAVNAALVLEVVCRDKVLDEVRAWAEDEYGDSTEVPTGLAMAIYRSVSP